MFGVEKLQIFPRLNFDARSPEKFLCRKRLPQGQNLYCLLLVHLGLCVIITIADHVDSLTQTFREQNFVPIGNEAQETEVEDLTFRQTATDISLGVYDDESLRSTAVEREKTQPLSVKADAQPKHEFTVKKTIPEEDVHDESEWIDFDTITVGPDYEGPRLEDGRVSLQFMRDLVQHFREKKRLHQKYAYQIVRKLRNYYRRQPTLIEIKMPRNQNLTICGDIHGQLYDLLNIFEINGWPSETNRYLFNGDFVNRGRYGVECVLLLFGFKLLYPHRFYLNRGNHESKMMSHYFGFNDEVKFKYSQKTLNMFHSAFQRLPLAHLINKKIFVVHAGLFSKDDVTMSDIKHIERDCDPVHNSLMFDMLWSDPKSTDGRSPNFMRGAGIEFGPDVTRAFCIRNQVDYIIRSHYPVKEGHAADHNHRLITVFSAPNYYHGNKGAILRLTAPEFEPQFITFTQMPEWDIDCNNTVESHQSNNSSQEIIKEQEESPPTRKEYAKMPNTNEREKRRKRGEKNFLSDQQ